jgi:hypothetical protein
MLIVLNPLFKIISLDKGIMMDDQSSIVGANIDFNAATCWWADGLAEPPGYLHPKVYTEPKGPDPRVQQITHNVLRRMLSR